MKYKASISITVLLALVAGAVVFAKRNPPVELMPTPTLISTGAVRPFEANPHLDPSTRLPVLFVTNRLPLLPPPDARYSILPGKELRFGVAHVRIGDDTLDWPALYKLSTTSNGGPRPLLRVERFDEQAKLGDDEEVGTDGPVRAFFDRVNTLIDQTPDRDVLVYVHGANSNVPRAASHAAQFRHFTGRRMVVILFAWPSAESLLRYATDVRNARFTVPVFARFLTLLADNTRAERIDVIAYSAGAQVVSPALALLSRELGGDAQRLRIGEVYFAAPDVDTRAFVADMAHYLPFVGAVTLSVNLNDRVLGIVQRRAGASRAGRPDLTELSDEDSRFLLDASGRAADESPFDLLNVQPETLPYMSTTAHAFWYDDPWVSSDILIKLQAHLRPERRALEANRAPDGVRYWTFPGDYPARLPTTVGRPAVPAEAAPPPPEAAQP